MDYALQPHLYKNVPVYLWPCVWWQLFQIERWIKETGRMVLVGVARDGKVYVLHVADDPNEIKPWSPKDLKPFKGRHQDWITALSPVHAPRHQWEARNQLGEAAPRHPWEALSASQNQALSQAFAYNPTRHGDQLTLAMRLLEWPPMLALDAHSQILRLIPSAAAQSPPSFLLSASQNQTSAQPHPTGRPARPVAPTAYAPERLHSGAFSHLRAAPICALSRFQPGVSGLHTNRMRA